MEPNSSMPKESEIMTEIWSGRDNRWRLCAKKRSRSCFEVWLALTSRGKWEDAVLSVKYCTNSTTIYMLSKNVHYIVIYLITWEQYDYFKRDKFHLLTSYYGNFPEISFRVPLSSLKFLWVPWNLSEFLRNTSLQFLRDPWCFLSSSEFFGVSKILLSFSEEPLSCLQIK